MMFGLSPRWQPGWPACTDAVPNRTRINSVDHRPTRNADGRRLCFDERGLVHQLFPGTLCLHNYPGFGVFHFDRRRSGDVVRQGIQRDLDDVRRLGSPLT